MSYQLSKEELRRTKLSKEEFRNLPRNEIIIVLDSLKCAHNIGTILRLSDALLVKKVYICGDTILPPNKKIKTSSRGAERWIDFEYVPETIEIVKKLKSEGVQIVSVEVADNSIDYTHLRPTPPICLVLGREFDGVSREILEISDHVVHLPLLGMSNSINVSTAASVVMYNVFNKLENNEDSTERQ